MAQSYIAPILPGYLSQHPKVKVFLEATDRAVNQIEERFDLVLRARPQMDGDGGMVVKTLGTARRILVASPAFLKASGTLSSLDELARYDVVSQLSDQPDGATLWSLTDNNGKSLGVTLNPRLVSSDLRVLHQAALHGIGIALMPSPIVADALRSSTLVQVLPEWTASEHLIHLVYPPRECFRRCAASSTTWLPICRQPSRKRDPEVRTHSSFGRVAALTQPFLQELDEALHLGRQQACLRQCIDRRRLALPL